MCFEGGTGSLENIYSAARKGIPTLVLRGSGGVSDLIAEIVAPPSGKEEDNSQFFKSLIHWNVRDSGGKFDTFSEISLIRQGLKLFQCYSCPISTLDKQQILKILNQLKMTCMSELCFVYDYKAESVESAMKTARNWYGT